MFIVIFCGDRNWTDRDSVRDFIKFWLPKHTLIVQGGCRGLDDIAKEVALELGYIVTTVKAEWSKYGKSAGPIRNERMMKLNPNWIVAFHENIDGSKGTKHMLGLAKKNKTSWALLSKSGIIDCEYYGD